MQLNHNTTHFEARKFPVILACESISNAANVGSLFRTADAFGVETLVFSDHQIKMDGKMRRSSRATEKSVNYQIVEDLHAYIEAFKTKGWHIVALEITSNSKPLTDFCFHKNRPLLLIVGNENLGISDNLLKLADDIIHLEMYGQNSSMNVVQAASIALYEITKQLR